MTLEAFCRGGSGAFAKVTTLFACMLNICCFSVSRYAPSISYSCAPQQSPFELPYMFKGIATHPIDRGINVVVEMGFPPYDTVAFISLSFEFRVWQKTDRHS